jgi:predicted enzyme related to lactoylglutathione lyase
MGKGRVTSDERGISSYTDKRTALSRVARGSYLDANGADELLSAIMIKQIKFISIPVADQKRALDFYTDKLGFTIITDQPFDEKQRWIELRVPKAETRVVLFTPEGEEKRIGTMMNMSYECDDIDKTYAELKKRGVEFEGPPQKQPWGTYAMFKDSEGNRFVVSS